jgi:hypothetical protein
LATFRSAGQQYQPLFKRDEFANSSILRLNWQPPKGAIRGQGKKSHVEHPIRIKQLPEAEVIRKDLIVTVHSESQAKRGELTIGRGGLGWHPSGPSNERHFTSEQFARYVKEWKG